MDYVQDFYNSIYKAVENGNYIYELSSINNGSNTVIETEISYPEYIKFK